MSKKIDELTGDAIAIIGMGGRFPGAEDLQQFWCNLRDGVEAIHTVTAEDLATIGVDPAILNNPDYVPATFALDGADLFDAAFFGFTPREAELMDPQQRLFLETAWRTLEHAGYDPDRYPGLIGVFGGVGRNSYFATNVLSHPQYREAAGEYYVMLGNERDFPTTHVSYRLNLRGPSMDVQSACSTSGVAIHLACQSLLNGDSDMALAGGAKVICPNLEGYRYIEGGPLSPEGHIRAFDANAAGMVRGSGCALILLKRLEDALADGDSVYALIVGSAINNDGSAKVGFTAPSVQGQALVIAEAIDNAGITADQVSYVETHGTGTRLGDPIELAGLKKAFAQTTDNRQFCAIGSVKTNIGHLDAGATAAAVIKTVLAMTHEQLPASLNFTTPNPACDFKDSPFFVNAELKPWPKGEQPRRAGVSSFGLGGTNVHLVLEEAPALPAVDNGQVMQVLVWSARTPNALEQATQRLRDHLAITGENLADIAYTLQQGRRAFECRRSLACASMAEAVAALDADTAAPASGPVEGEAAVAFMFPGGGTQYLNMARDLYHDEPVFAGFLDQCASELTAIIDLDIRQVIFDPDDTDAARQALVRPSLALPALFAVEYALAQLWLAWGVKPSAMIGHSMGEYTAACLADVFSLNDALALVSLRGRLFERLEPGAMLSLPFGAEKAERYLSADLCIAAINRPDQCVLSGSVDAIERVRSTLASEGIDTAPIHIAVAAHSVLVEPILAEFQDVLQGIALAPPAIPFVSNVSGTWITAEQATDPAYWAAHLRQTVRFSEGVATLLERGNSVLLEVGPGQTLSTFARQHPARKTNAGTAVVSSLRHPHESTHDSRFLAAALGRLWQAGVVIDWRAKHGKGLRRRVALPTYPFERKRYWLDPVLQAATAGLVSESQSQVLPGTPTPNVTTAPAPPITAMPPVAVSDPYPPAVALVDRSIRILTELQSIVSSLSGLEPAELKPNATFLELGFDSLFLSQINAAFRKRFQIRLSVRQLLEQLPNLAQLSIYLDEQLPDDAFAVTDLKLAAAPPESTTQPVPVPMSADGPLCELSRQLATIQAQLASLGANVPAIVTPSAPLATVDHDRTSPWQPVAKGAAAAGGTLSNSQQAYLDRLLLEVQARTPRSKVLTQANRGRLADPRTVQGFKQLWKEIVYPVVSDRAQGSRIWDIDGNEYIDVVSGYGSNFFGHAPDFVIEAVEQQLYRSIAIGPQSPMAGEVADLVSELTGVERVAFCNTGSEAVLAAIRVARTVTGRDRLAVFSGHYHGIFDEVLVKGIKMGTGRRAMPISPGILLRSVEDVLVMDYGDPVSFDLLREHADDIALVLLEPFRSRDPGFRPVEFVQGLREVTQSLDIPLLFDEMVTGFRIHPGGAQHIYGVRADLVTYGKVLGAGFPIGVVAGSAQYMDALDGGMWQYGDNSQPEADMTWFAGTFVRHPLALAAAKAALTRLKEAGPALQETIAAKVTAMADELNDYFRATRAPLYIEHFSSVFIVKFDPPQECSSLLFQALQTQGVYAAEGRPAYFTMAHTDADAAHIVDAFKTCVAALQRAGFFPGQPPQGADEVLDIALADGQQEIWLVAKRNEDASRAYNLANTLRLRGLLDRSALLAALQQLFARHDALRAIPSHDGMRQRILPPSKISSAPVATDLRGLAPASRTEQLEALKVAEVETPFDLDNGPLARTRLIRLGENEHMLILTVHHLIADGWSGGVLLRDLGKLYAAIRQDPERPAVLPAPMQLAEWVQLRQTVCASEDYQQALAYWRKEFATPVPVLNLPTHSERPPRKTYRARRIEVPVAAEFAAEIKTLAANQGVTTFVCLLSAFQTLIARLAQQDDIVIGFSLAGQSQITDRDLVGHCVNFLPVRVQLGSQLTFAELMRFSRGKSFDAIDNQSVTFGSLVKELRVPRDPARVPLMSVAFNLDPSSKGMGFGDLEVTPGSVPRRYENFDIFFNVVETADAFLLQSTFNLDLFSIETMQCWLGIYQDFLRQAIRDPEAPLAEFVLPSDVAAELQAEATSLDEDVDEVEVLRPVYRLIAEQAARTPVATALEVAGQSLSYAELEARSNQLAHYLVEQGIGIGDRVGVCLDRTLDLPLGLLAVWKAGAVYVPLDPTHPLVRLTGMVNASALAAVITERRFADRFQVSSMVLLLEEARAAATILPPTAPSQSTAIDATGLAYVIFTSGSTGRSKGVQISHGAFSNLIQSMQTEPGLSAGQRLLAVTTVSFDIAGLELFLPLTVGATAVLARSDEARDPFQLRRLLEGGAIDVMQATPTTWRMLIDVGWEGSPALCILCGGEALSEALAVALQERAGEVWNMYGPTETTVWSTCQRITSGRPVTLGKPIANTSVYVLDESMQPVAAGRSGELWIGGAGVADGYLGLEAMTSNRFRSSPFRGGERIYKTGDLVRLTNEGELEFLGRTDCQVKVRGHRIELAEIESILEAVVGVRQAVLTTQPDSQGNTQLVAYVSIVKGHSFDPQQMRRACNENLPNYMIPAVFVEQDNFPLTATGKIDRRSLSNQQQQDISTSDVPAEPVATAETTTDNSAAMTTNTLTAVKAIWRDQLKCDEIGDDDDFFTLGGHSLLAVQIVLKLRDLYQIEFGLGILIEHPTVAQLAVSLEQDYGVGAGVVTGPVSGLSPAPTTALADQESDVEPLLATGRASALLTLQQRLFWEWYIEGGDQSTDHIWQARRIQGALDVAALECALHVVVRRHAVLRSRFACVDGIAVQYALANVEVPFAVVDWRGSPAEDHEQRIAAFVREQQAMPFDLAQDPPLRASLAQLGDDDHLLVLTFHLIAFDGWSTGLLLGELDTCLRALQAGAEPQLEPLPIQYIDFALWQKRWLQSETARSQLEHWRMELGGALEMPRLPAPRSDTPQACSASFFTFNIDTDAQAYRELAKFSGANLQSVALATLALLLHSYTGQRELVITVPDAGRQWAETVSSIGCYYNPLPIRIALEPGIDFAELCKQAHTRLIAAKRNGAVPFVHILAKAAPQAVRDNPDALLRLSCLFTQGSMIRTDFGNNRATILNNGGRVGRHDLSLTFGDFGDFLMITLEFDTGRFDSELVEDVKTRLRGLMRAIIEQPVATIATLIGAFDRDPGQMALPPVEAASSAVSAAVSNASGEAAHASAVVLRKGEADTAPLICVCGIYLYQALARALPGQRPVYGVFVEADTQTFINKDMADIAKADTATVEEMARSYVEQIRIIQPRGPYHLTGLSFGGLLAYEIAHQLLAAGEEVATMVMLDTTAPNSLKIKHFNRIKHHVGNIRTQGRKYLFEKIQKKMKEVTAGDLLSAELTERMRTAPTPEERTRFVRAALYLKATKQYVPKPYKGNMGLVVALDNPYKDLVESPEIAWRRLAAGRFMVDRLPGDHTSILKVPIVTQLAKKLAMMLGDTTAERPK